MSTISRKDFIVRFIVDSEKGLKDLAKVKQAIQEVNKAANSGGSSKGGMSISGGGTPKIPGIPSPVAGGAAPPGGGGGGLAGMFKGLSGGGGGVLSSLTSGLGSLSGAAGAAAGGLGGVLSSVAGLIPGIGPLIMLVGGLTAAFKAVGAAMDAVWKAGMQTEKQIMKLGVILKDEQKGMETFRKAQAYADVTPFKSPEVINAAITSAQYGFDAFDKKALKSGKMVIDVMADMAAFSGQSMEEASSALMRGDLMLLEKYGKGAREAILQARKTSGGDQSLFLKNFVSLMGDSKQAWTGMAVKLGESMEGMVSTIEDATSSLARAFSGAELGSKAPSLWNSLRAIMKDIRDGWVAFTQWMGPHLTAWGTALGDIFMAVWDIGKAIWEFIGPVVTVVGKGIIWVVTIVFKIIGFIFQVISAIFRILGSIGKFIWEMSAKFWSWIDGILGLTEGMKDTIKWMELFWVKMQIMWVTFKIFMVSLWNWVKKFVTDDIPNWFKELYNDSWIRSVVEFFTHTKSAGFAFDRGFFKDDFTPEELAEQDKKDAEEKIAKEKKAAEDKERNDYNMVEYKERKAKEAAQELIDSNEKLAESNRRLEAVSKGTLEAYEQEKWKRSGLNPLNLFKGVPGLDMSGDSNP